MIAIKTSYPEFVPNQVLTNTQLNQLREYLDAQDRLGRVRLVGIGKVCGLQWTQDAATHHITLCEGFGVSSDGYLLSLEDITFTHFRTYQDPDLDDEGEPRYEPWQTPGDIPGQIDILELLDAEAAAEAESPTALAAATGAGRVLVLYLEKLPVELTSCLVTDCDNKGLNIHLTARALLVKESDLETVAPCEGPLQMVRIPRLHTQIDLDAVATASDINDGYEKIVSAAVTPLLGRIQQAFDRYGKFLDLDAGLLGRVSVLDERIAIAAKAKGITQYHYDALKDVATAYNEAASAACALITDCCPEGDFPRHLMLGAMGGADGYSNELMPSPVRNVLHGDLERVRKLFLRIEALCQSMDFGAGDGGVLITPSHTEAHSLGSRAIPYYYKSSSEMRDYWQPETCCTTDPLWSYHTHSTPKHGSDLEYDYNRCTLLRIEGHLNGDCDAAAQAILKERRKHNVALDVLCSYLGDGDSDADNELAQTLAEIRQQRSEALGKLQEALSGAATSEVKVLSDSLRDLNLRVIEEKSKWLATKGEGKLHCDLSHLQMDYLVVRSALQCHFYGLRGTLGRIAQALADSKKLSLRPELASGAKVALLDRLASTVAAQREASAATDKRVEESLQHLSKADAGQLATLALQAALDALLENLRALLEEHLPPDLRKLDFTLFLDRYKAVVCDLIYFLLLCHAYGFPLRGAIDGKPENGDAPAPEEQEPMTSELLSAVRSCHHTTVSALYHAYEQVRRHDLTRFANLAALYDGLEHLAGVEKCGTFVLVCEPAGAQGKVVADFSLPCHLPCCCEVNPEDICLPPVALPDYRILTLQAGDDGKTYLPIDKRVHVLANDYDPRFQTGPGQPPEPFLELVLDEKQSELGAKLQVLSGGIVEYLLEDPSPGVIDRFGYRVTREDETCPGEDRGCVLLLLLPEPAPTTGTIVGTVRNVKGDPEPESLVTIQETGVQTFAGPNGEFAFSDLAAGTYTLEAKLGDDASSGPKVVTLGEGATVTVDLVLLEATGAIAGIVAFEGGGPAGGSTVTVLDTGDTDVTTADGQYRFLGLPPKTYALQPALGGLVGEQATAIVKAGETTTLNLVLPAQQPTGNVRVTVVYSNETPVPLALVSIVDSKTGGDTFAADDFTPKEGAVDFKDVPADKYDISASLAGFTSPTLLAVEVAAGVTNEFGIMLEPAQTPDIPDVFIGRIAELNNAATDETQKRVEALYAERYTSQLAGLGIAAREPSVKESLSYQQVEQFFTDTLVAPDLTEAVLLESHKEVSSSLSKAISAASPDSTGIYRDLLINVSRATLDRLTITNADTLSPAASGALDQIAGTLKQAGVDLGQFKTDWQGDRLGTELNLGSVDKMMAILS